MALDLKPLPRCLSVEPTGSIWPGDPDVDLDASDLAEWCRSGGQEGLVLRPGGAPTIIRWRPLTPQAMSAVSSVAFRDPGGYVFAAAAHGIIPSAKIGLTRDAGTTRLSDASLTRLAELRMPLPILIAYDALAEADGTGGEPSGSVELVEASYAEILGLHVLAATFRLASASR